MKTIKGFMEMQSFVDNVPWSISPLGELSNLAKTFSKEVGHYSRPSQPDVDLRTFLSRDGENLVAAENALVEPILQIGQWMFEGAATGLFNDTTEDFVSSLLSEFSSIIEDVEAGNMVNGGENRFLPEYIQFTVRTVADSYVKIWFADDAFQRQYDEFELVIVPPLDNLDDLIRTPVEVKASLDQIDDSGRQTRIQQAKNNYPDTLTKVELFEWSSPLQPEIILNTYWGIIIYGPAGNNVDSIRNALVEYVLANSSYEREVWEEHLPDIFKTTEYTIVPFWDKYAIDNQTLQRGVLSPTVRHKDVLAIAKASATEYPEAHVEEYVETSAVAYRSLSFAIIGGPDNRDGIMTFYGRFKDYITLPTTSTEFSRMDPVTQAWIVKFVEMLRTADDMTEFSDIPVGMTRLIRNDIMYLVATFNEVQYLVLSRQSYEQLVTNLGEG